jgi:hypothetical protein
MQGRALGARETGASAKAASLRDAILLWQRWELISMYGRSMTFRPVTGRQRSARGRGFLADDVSTRSGHESIGRCPSRGAFATRNTGCRPQEHRPWRSVSAVPMRRRKPICPQNPLASFAGSGSSAGLPDVRTWRNRNTKIVNSLLLRLATCHGKGQPGTASELKSRTSIAVCRRQGQFAPHPAAAAS